MAKSIFVTAAFAGLVLAAASGGMNSAFAQSTDKGLNPEANVRESQNYNQLVASSPSFRNKRMNDECSPITDEALRQQCVDSFGAPPAQTATTTRATAPGPQTLKPIKTR